MIKCLVFRQPCFPKAYFFINLVAHPSCKHNQPMQRLLGLFMISAFFATPIYANECEELSVGKSRILDVDKEKSITRVRQKYALYRESLDTYEIIVRPSFIGKFREDEQVMAEKVSSCLAENAFSLTADDDIKLRLKVYDESDLSKIEYAPPLVYIMLAGEKSRASSGSYPIDIQCKTIVHEVLHLTGLVDEYNEFVGNHRLYPSRSLGPSKSIMSEMGKGLFGQTKPKVYPAHVRHILYPGCLEKNSIYYSCAKNAYVQGDVEELPKVCKKKSWID